MTHLNSSSDIIFSLLDELITNQMKIIAGKLLVKYLSNQLSDSMRDRVIDNFMTNEDGEPNIRDVINNLHIFHDNITITNDNITITNDNIPNNDIPNAP
jgi:hypothetical protein